MISRYLTSRPADQHQELAAGAQKDAHVEQAAEHDHDAGRPADARPKLLLEQLRDRHDAGVAQGLDAEAGEADDEHRQAIRMPGVAPAKPFS